MVGIFSDRKPLARRVPVMEPLRVSQQNLPEKHFKALNVTFIKLDQARNVITSRFSEKTQKHVESTVLKGSMTCPSGRTVIIKYFPITQGSR